MKWMIASDIHGSAYYCGLLIERFKEEKADRLVLLGDVLYHGPRNDLPKDYAPKEVIRMLGEIKESVVSVRGNCDTEVDQMVLPFPVLADYCMIDLGDRMVYCTHGHVYNKENPPPLKSGDVLMCGHTHVPKNEPFGEFTYMNPGSVSIPKENSHHGYITVFNGEFCFKDLSGQTVNI